MAGKESALAIIADLIPTKIVAVSSVFVVADLSPPLQALTSSVFVVADLIEASGSASYSALLSVWDLEGPSLCPRVSRGIVSGSYSLDIAAEQYPSTPYGGSVCCGVVMSEELELVSPDAGTLITQVLTIPAGSSAYISPRDMLDPFGFTAGITEVWFCSFVANGGEVTIQGDSLNPWNLISGELVLQDGARFTALSNVLQFIPATPSSHRLKVNNAGASSVQLTVKIIGAK